MKRISIFLTYMLVSLSGLAVIYYFNQENSLPKYHLTKDVTDQVEVTSNSENDFQNPCIQIEFFDPALFAANTQLFTTSIFFPGTAEETLISSDIPLFLEQKRLII